MSAMSAAGFHLEKHRICFARSFREALNGGDILVPIFPAQVACSPLICHGDLQRPPLLPFELACSLM
jgi:hypothetical protein